MIQWTAGLTTYAMLLWLPSGWIRRPQVLLTEYEHVCPKNPWIFLLWLHIKTWSNLSSCNRLTQLHSRPVLQSRYNHLGCKRERIHWIAPQLSFLKTPILSQEAKFSTDLNSSFLNSFMQSIHRLCLVHRNICMMLRSLQGFARMWYNVFQQINSFKEYQEIRKTIKSS